MADQIRKRPDDAARRADEHLAQLPPQAGVIRTYITPAPVHVETTHLYNQARGADTALRELDRYGERELPRKIPHMEGGLKHRHSEARRHEVRVQIDATEQTMAQFVQTLQPALRERLEDETQDILEELAEARHEAEEGDPEAAEERHERARAKVAKLRRVAGIETVLIEGGIEEAVGEGELDALLDGLESAVLDAGTENEERGDAILEAAELYAENSEILDADSEDARGLRERILGFIMESGFTAGIRERYEEETRDSDREALNDFRTRLDSLLGRMRAGYTNVLQELSQDLGTRLGTLAEDSPVRERMQSLLDRIGTALERLRGENWREERGEIGEIGQEYSELTREPGEVMEQTPEEAEAALRESATSLRGSGREADRLAQQEGTQQWFAEKALDALQSGKLEVAGLTLSMGLLERAAKTLGLNASDLVPQAAFARIMDIVGGRTDADGAAVEALRRESGLDARSGFRPEQLRERFGQHVQRLQANLREAGAPEWLTNALGAATGFLGTAEEPRAGLLMRAATTFMQNRHRLETPQGEGILGALQSLVTQVADGAISIDMEAAERGFDQVDAALAGLPEAERPEESLEAAIPFFQQLLREDALETLEPQINALIRDNRNIIERLARGEHVSDEELQRLEARNAQLTAISQTLQGIPQRNLRQQVARIYAAALDVLAGGGSDRIFGLLFL
ncbi:MAG: hypothetical protein AB1529_08555, partial [Candidatus Micrarchaeota archaeon]